MMEQKKSRDVSLTFQLHNCSAWKQAESLFESVKIAMNLGNLLPLENKTVEIENGNRARPVAKELDEWLIQNYHLKSEWDEKGFDRFYPKEEFACSLRTTLEPEWCIEEPLSGTIEIRLDASCFGPTYNYLEFRCLLHGETLLRGRPVLPYTLDRADEVANLYLRFAQPLISQLNPQYVLIGDGRDHNLISYGHEVINAQIKAIHWYNYFGSEYLRKYGEEVFLNAPGWQVERTENGVWYLLTKHFSDFSEHFPTNQKETLEEKILHHFGQIGIGKAG